MLKDPLANNDDALDLFGQGLREKDGAADLASLRPADCRRVFPRVAKLVGTARANRALIQVTRPEQRLTMELASYHFLPAASPVTSAPGEERDPRRLVTATLGRGALDLWRPAVLVDDLRGGDWSRDFQPLAVIDARAAGESDFEELDIHQGLPAPRPGL